MSCKTFDDWRAQARAEKQAAAAAEKKATARKRAAARRQYAEAMHRSEVPELPAPAMDPVQPLAISRVPEPAKRRLSSGTRNGT